MIKMNESEEKIRLKYEAQGYNIIHKGVPDFILLKDGKIEFVEVKAATDPLRESQIRAVALLRKHGFEVRVERIPDVKPSSLLQEWKEKHNPIHPSPCHSKPCHTIPAQSTPLDRSKPHQTISTHAGPGHSSPYPSSPNHTLPGQTTPHQSHPKKEIM